MASSDCRLAICISSEVTTWLHRLPTRSRRSVGYGCQSACRPKQPVSMRGSNDRFTQNFGHAWTGGQILPLVEECERKRGWWIDRHAYGRQACSVGAL